jgi:hypothetical protein
MGGGGGAPAPLGPELVIRWESAAPVQAATHLELPESLAGLYAISITGLPPEMMRMALAGRGGRGRGAEQPTAPVDPAVRQKELIDKLLHSVALTVKGRDPQSAVVVQQTKIAQTLVFGFEKTALPLTETDKEVLFTLKLGTISAKAKFEPKEMMFDGKLAL